MGSEEIKIFKDALDEEGVDAEVSHHDDPTGMREIFRVRTWENGESYAIDKAIDARERAQIDNIKQHIAYLAADAARSIADINRERLEWGHKAVQVDSNGEPRVTCLRCGESVSAADVRASLTPTIMAESSVPNPPSCDLRSLSDRKIRMTLLAKLTDECKSSCSNSILNRNI